MNCNAPFEQRFQLYLKRRIKVYKYNLKYQLSKNSTKSEATSIVLNERISKLSAMVST